MGKIKVEGRNIMSMDFVYDLKEKLDEQKMEYLIMVVKTGEDKSVIDAFYNVSKDDSRVIMCECMDTVCDAWAQGAEPPSEVIVSEDGEIEGLFGTDLDEDSPYLTNEDEDEEETDE